MTDPLHTFLISPQFHCTYDDYFETPKLEGNIDVHWKHLAHIQDNEETELYDKEFNTVQGKPLKDYEPPPSLLPPSGIVAYTSNKR